MDTDTAKYVFIYYSHLMTEHEQLAYRHLVGTAKATHGRSDVEAQEEAKGAFHFREMLSDDPNVLRLARDGIEAFIFRTGQRILNDHRDQIFLNCCLRCGALTRSPKARQCRFCRYDWHSEGETQRRNMRCLRFAIRLPSFLIAEAVLWSVASFGSHLGLHRPSEALAQHRRLVDWLWDRKAGQW
jgi:hypothetical protein